MNDVFNALQQGIAPAIIVVIYLIVIRIIDGKREAKQTKLNSDLVKSISTISNFLNKVTDNIISKDKDKSKIAIEDSFNTAAMRITKFVTQTIVNNNVQDNKDVILANTRNLVKSEYYTIYATLSLYGDSDMKLSYHLKQSWIDDIEKDIKSTIFNTKLDAEHKILSFTNKIDIRFKTYITYVINNGLK